MGSAAETAEDEVVRVRGTDRDIRLRQSYDVLGEHQYTRKKDGKVLRVERISITTNMATHVPPRLNYLEIYGSVMLPNGRLGMQLAEMMYPNEDIPRWARELAHRQVNRMKLLAGEGNFAEKEPRKSE